LHDEIIEFRHDVTESEIVSENPLTKIGKICNRFHLIASQIRNRHDNRPTIDVEDEYDVQDLLQPF
jgi:hypothetical protein